MWRCNCRLLILSILVVCLQRQFLVSEEEWFQADFFPIPCLAKASYAVFLCIWTLLNWQCKIFCRKNVECYSMIFKSEHFPVVLSCETLLFFFLSLSLWRLKSVSRVCLAGLLFGVLFLIWKEFLRVSPVLPVLSLQMYVYFYNTHSSAL